MFNLVRFNRTVFAATAMTFLGLGGGSSLAQTPAAPTAASPWVSLAPFPDASEEVLGATANGKLYVFCGLGPAFKPKGLVYEYDPATNAWTEKKPMALPSHHVAFTTLNDKIYAFGGFKLPESGPPAWYFPLFREMATAVIMASPLLSIRHCRLARERSR